MLTPLSSGSRTTAEEHEDGKDDMPQNDLAEDTSDYGVRGKDTVHDWAAVAVKIVPVAPTGLEGA